MLRAPAALTFAAVLLAGGLSEAQEAKKKGTSKAVEAVEVVASSLPEDLASEIRKGEQGWLPFYVELRSLRDRPVVVDLTGLVKRRDNENTVWSFTARRRVEVPPGAPTRAWLYLRYEGQDFSNLDVEVQWKAEGTTQQLQRGQIHLVPEGEQSSIPMIAVGEHTQSTLSPWGDSSLELSKVKIGHSRIVRMEEKELPNHLLGYRGVRILLLRNINEKVLEAAQLEAIRQWVYLGGWVILVPSPKGEIFRSQLLRDLLPGAKIGEPRALAGQVHQDPWVTPRRPRFEDGEKPPPEGIPYTLVDPIEIDALREIKCHHHEGPKKDGPATGTVRLYLEAACGGGRVGVLTFDDLTHGEESIPFRRKFWSLLLDGAQGGQWAPPQQDSFAAAIQAGLKREVGVWAIVGMVVVYLLIIGPGLYLLLKKLGRLPSIVWVEPLVVVVYLGIIAATAYITKGFLTKVQTIHVVHHSREQPFVLEQSYLGLFSADEASYRIAAPKSDDLYALGDVAAADMDLSPVGKGPALRGFRLAKWATGSFAAWSVREVAPSTGVTVEAPEGETDPEAITIQNGTGVGFRQGFVRLGSRIISTGELGPGARKRIEKSALVEVPAKTSSDPGNADPFGGDKLLRQAVDAVFGSSLSLSKGSALSSRAHFVGILDREEADFVVDHPTNLDHRVDLWAEYP
jgi:hypothetical protein